MTTPAPAGGAPVAAPLRRYLLLAPAYMRPRPGAPIMLCPCNTVVEWAGLPGPHMQWLDAPPAQTPPPPVVRRYRLTQRAYIPPRPGEPAELMEANAVIRWAGPPGPHMIPLADPAPPAP